jgi:hypothetical protein
VDGTSIILELLLVEDMGVDVVATPVVVDCTSVMVELIVVKGTGVDVMPTLVVVDGNSVVLVVVEDTAVLVVTKD